MTPVCGAGEGFSIRIPAADHTENIEHPLSNFQRRTKNWCAVGQCIAAASASSCLRANEGFAHLSYCDARRFALKRRLQPFDGFVREKAKRPDFRPALRQH